MPKSGAPGPGCSKLTQDNRDFDLSFVTFSLRTQTYLRLSLVSAENNVCEPEPGNDFCDVMTFDSPWPIRLHDKMKLECSSQRIPRAVVLRLLELDCDWLKIPTSEKSFPGSGSQTLFFGGDERQPERRLRSQAM